MKAKTAQEILTRLENAVQHDLIIRKQGRTGKSPKSIHLEALQELTTAIEEIIGEDERLDSKTPKGYYADVFYGRNKLRADQRLRATAWLGRN